MIKQAFVIAAIWSSLSIESSASQQKISGSNLANLIVERLTKRAHNPLSKGRVFMDAQAIIF